jgi:2-keto-3-deoxy-galactonokinase
MRERLPVFIIVCGMASERNAWVVWLCPVEVPAGLLEQAQEATGSGVTQTIRTGLQLLAASRSYARLREMRGKVRFSQSLADLKADR